ncbi:MAG: hypothetical protein AAGC45_06670 [Bacteroidota bacterium]
MGILNKRAKASTLMETLVATVLIVVVFMVASLVLNSLFANSIAQNDQEVQQELLELQYRYENNKLELPYYGEIGAWQLEVSALKWKNGDKMIFRAVHKVSQKELEVQLDDTTH